MTKLFTLVGLFVLEEWYFYSGKVNKLQKNE